MKTSSKLLFFIGGYLIFNLIIPLGILVNQGLKADIFEIIKIASDPIAIHTYWVTLKLAIIATCFNVTFGLILAWVLVRYEFFGRNFVNRERCRFNIKFFL